MLRSGKSASIVAGALAAAALVVTGPMSAEARPKGTGAAGYDGCALPDLRAQVPYSLQLQDTFNQTKSDPKADGNNNDGNSTRTEYLRFSNGIANTGAGPLEIVPLGNSTTGFNDAKQYLYTAAQAELIKGDIDRCDAADPALNPCNEVSLASAFFYHPEHNHYHLKAVAGFTVYTALDKTGQTFQPGQQWGETFKETFCLIDYVPLEDTKPGTRTYWDCVATDACQRTQGITAGWVDAYHQSTPLQGVNISGTPNDVYYLVSESNPERLFVESDYTNNIAWVSFQLSDDNQSNKEGNPRKITLLGHSACTGLMCGKDWGGTTTNR
jgi:hypothetical protein